MTDETAEAVVSDGNQRAASYIAGRPVRGVRPTAEAISALKAFEEPMPQHGTAAAEVIDMLDRLGSPATVQTNGPRYFGFVTGGAMPVARAAASLGSAWDQNGALDVMSPTAAALDDVVTRWVSDLIGLGHSSTGVFCGGASEANLIGMITARDTVLRTAGWDAQAHGLFGAPEVTVVVGSEVHVSLTKALGLAGLGRDRVKVIGTDDQGRIDVAELESTVVPDGPGILCLQAGNVNTGHSDHFESAIRWAKARGFWCHIDGAFGLWAAASEERRHLIAGHHLADSWALDCHKWLNVPYDAALAYVADGANLRQSMAAEAAYLGATSARAPMHLGLQMSQKARAIDSWAVLKHLGSDGVADLIDRSCELATRFANGLAESGVEILHDVVLNQILARYGDDETTDAVIVATQDDRTCWVGPTTWHGQRAMRISVSGFETTEEDVDASVTSILRCWERVSDQHRQ